MGKSSEGRSILKSENFFGFAIILVTAVATGIIEYTQHGMSVYILVFPIIVIVALFFAYESFKAFLRMVGRELERGKSEVQDEVGKRKLLMLVCPKCKAKNPADAAHCFNCGEKL